VQSEVNFVDETAISKMNIRRLITNTINTHAGPSHRYVA